MNELNPFLINPWDDTILKPYLKAKFIMRNKGLKKSVSRKKNICLSKKCSKTLLAQITNTKVMKTNTPMCWKRS